MTASPSSPIAVGVPPPPPPLLRPEREVVASWERSGTPEVSICCATYNHGEYIEDALRGFLGQVTTFPFEVIVRDDASTDGTADIIRRYAAEYPQIIRPILETTNRYREGVKPSPIMLGAARGDFIAWCEGDDYWIDAQKLQKQWQALQRRPDASCAFHDTLVFDATGVVSTSYLPRRSRRDHSSFDMMALRKFSHASSLLFRRLDVSVLFPPEVAHVRNGDRFRYSILGQHGPAVYVGDIVPSARRVHAGGIWSKKEDQYKAITHAVSAFWIAEYYTRLGVHPRVTNAIRARSASYLLSSLPPRSRTGPHMRVAIASFRAALVDLTRNAIPPSFLPTKRQHFP